MLVGVVVVVVVVAVAVAVSLGVITVWYILSAGLVITDLLDCLGKARHPSLCCIARE